MILTTKVYRLFPSQPRQGLAAAQHSPGQEQSHSAGTRVSLTWFSLQRLKPQGFTQIHSYHCFSSPHYSSPCYFFATEQSTPQKQSDVGFQTGWSLHFSFILMSYTWSSQQDGKILQQAPLGKGALKGTGAAKAAQADAVSKGSARPNNQPRHRDTHKQFMKHQLHEQSSTLTASFPLVSCATNCHCRLPPSIRPFFPTKKISQRGLLRNPAVTGVPLEHQTAFKYPLHSVARISTSSTMLSQEQRSVTVPGSQAGWGRGSWVLLPLPLHLQHLPVTQHVSPAFLSSQVPAPSLFPLQSFRQPKPSLFEQHSSVVPQQMPAQILAPPKP